MDTISSEKQPLRILFLASDPSNAARLHLGKELQEVRNKLIGNSYFEIKDHQAVKPDDVIQTIIGYKPNIVHFSGHGQETGELCFEDEQGESKVIAPEALASLFGLATEHVKCVILNTCYSNKQAKAIAQFVPVVIGTQKEISDNAAIKFSTGFYTSLDPDLSQKSLEKAFMQGRISIQFDGNLNEHFTPVIIFGSPEIRFSSEVDTAFLSISQPQGLAVKTLIKGLSLIGKKMGLPEEVINKIIDDKILKLQGYNESIIEYGNSLNEILREEFPLSESSLAALLQFQIGLGLSNEDALMVKNKILSDPKLVNHYSWYDRGRAQNKLKNYDQEIVYYSKAIEVFPEYSAAFYERGNAYHQLQKFDLAIGDFNESIKYNKNWEVENSLSLAYFCRGLSYYNMLPQQAENVALALNDWSESIELNPNQVNAYYNRGLAYQFLRRFEEAIAEYKKSLEFDTINTNKVKAGRVTSIIVCYQELGNQSEVNKWTAVGLKYLDEPETA